MTDWESELRSLAPYCDRIKGSASPLEGELEHLLEARENISALIYTRRALEVVVTDLCQTKLGHARGTAPLLGILKEFESKAKKESVVPVPKHILASMRHLNEIGNLAAHPYEFSIQQIREALIALSTVLEWYVGEQKPASAVRASPAAAITGNPYRGLEAFREEDADRFFGREQLTLTLWDRCRMLHQGKQNGPNRLRFLCIHGPSGSGKSSVARAGLLPEIARHPWEPLHSVRMLTLMPGHHPLRNLGRALAELATGDPSSVGKANEFETRLCEGGHDGLAAIAEALPASAQQPLVLLIDQFEELYTLCEKEKERRAFIDNLLDAAGDPVGHVLVLTTLRSDFLGETQAHPRLNQAIADHNAFVPAMDEEGLRRAIGEPARLNGQPLDDATIELLIEQSAGREGVLPLLQFALTRIWEGLKQGTAPAATLTEIGGVGGALAHKAEALYKALPEAEQKIARRAFLQLIRLGEGTRDTRRRAAVEEMTAHDEDPATVRRVLREFSCPDARLITLTDQQGRTVAEITHEALLEHWGSLKGWLSESRADLRFADRLNEAVQHWQEHGRAKGLLWWQAPDYDLLEAFQVRQQLTSGQMGFYRASRVRRRRERGAKIALFGLLVGLTVVSLGAAGWALRAERQAVDAKNLVVKQKELALEAIHAMTYDLAAKLALLPRSGSIVKDILRKNTELLDKIYALDPDASRALKEKASNLSLVGDEWLESGNTRRAQEAYRQSLEIGKKLAATDPDNKWTQLHLSLAYNKIGRVRLRLGNTHGALGAYLKGLEIREKLARADPDNNHAQRDLLVSLIHIGDLQLQLGDTQKALATYQKVVEIAEKGAHNDMTNRRAQRDLSLGYTRLGDVKSRLTDTQGALAAYRKGLEISEKLARADPEIGEAHRDLAVIYGKVGDLQLEQSNAQYALKAYQKGLEIAEKLAREDPGNSLAKRDLCVSYMRLGDAQIKLQNAQGALATYQKALEIAEKVAHGDPESNFARRDLVLVYSKVGNAQYKLNDAPVALQFFRQALTIARELAKDTQNQQAQNHLKLVEAAVKQIEGEQPDQPLDEEVRTSKTQQ